METTITNEEKARVLSVKASCEAYFDEEAQKQYQNPSTETIARVNAYGACMEMAEWKDEQHEKEKQQMIERTIKWFSENYCYITDKQYDVEVVHELIDELKQTIKGE